MALAVSVGVAVAVFAPAPVVQAQDGPALGLVAISSTKVFVDPAEGSVDVIHRYRFQNTTLGGVFTEFSETIPRDAVDIQATTSDEPLPLVGSRVRDEVAEWRIVFPEPLAAGEEIDVEVRWSRQRLDSLPNDEDLLSPTLVAFAPFAVGHGGAASLTVRVRGEFDVVEGAGLDVEVVDGITVLHGDTVTEYEGQLIVLEALGGLASSRIDGIDLDIEVTSPPAAVGWLVAELRTGVPALAEWIPLSPPESIELRQGWTGGAMTRRGDDGAVIVSPNISLFDVLTIVADQWLADIAFTDPEVRLGLAAAIASRSSDPTRNYTLGITPWSRTTDALVDIEPETFAAALTALDAGTPAYAGPLAIDIPAAVDWRRVLDVFEHLAGVSRASTAFEFSVDADSRAELRRRETALVEYRALSDRAAPWILPPLLRRPMSGWNFDSFLARQGPVSEFIEARDELQAAAEEAGLEIGDGLQNIFEAAPASMNLTWELFAEQSETLETVVEARGLDIGDRGLLSALGMVGYDAEARLATILESWDDGEFSAAAHQAETLVDEYEGAVGRGTLRLILPAGAVVLIGAAGRALRRWLTP